MDLSRQIIFEHIGKEKQKLIEEAKIAVIGIGGLGTVVSELLVRSGVGNLLIIDRDFVEESNLQRQSLFLKQDVGELKAYAAKKRLKEINPELKVKTEIIDLNYKNINLLDGTELIVDCSDNMYTRFLINEYCLKNNKKWVYGSVVGARGMVKVFDGKNCFKCLFSEPSEIIEGCSRLGVINTAVYSIASLQVMQVIKIIIKEKYCKDLIVYDVWKERLEKIKVEKKEGCCNTFEYLAGKKYIPVHRLCNGKYQVDTGKVSLIELNQKYGGERSIHFLKLKDVIFFKDGRCLVDARSGDEVKAILDRYL